MCAEIHCSGKGPVTKPSPKESLAKVNAERLAIAHEFLGSNKDSAYILDTSRFRNIGITIESGIMHTFENKVTALGREHRSWRYSAESGAFLRSNASLQSKLDGIITPLPDPGKADGDMIILEIKAAKKSCAAD